MNSNIYSKNYFTPYEDLSEPEVIPAEIIADDKANSEILKIHAQLKEDSIKRYGRLNYKFMYNSLFKESELKFSEFIFDSLELKERIDNQNNLIRIFNNNL
jgi:hypothetical protein